MMASDRRPIKPSQAAHPGGHGCLFRFLLPPLSVIIIGLSLTLLLSQLHVEAAETAPKQTKVGKNEGGIADVDPPGLAPLFTPQVLYWEEKILTWSDQKGLDPNLVATVMQIESCGDPQARSIAGAMGLFQVMPYHFQEGENPYHPPTNAKRGLAYLKQALAKGGNIRLALAGYNGGIQGAQRPSSAWSAETKRYVYWGKGIYADAKAGKDHSPRLEEWLESGGARLCQQAKARLKP
ncbi:MAG: lytic transglycosylase domain-containing protein [Anaerolineales bacterium]